MKETPEELAGLQKMLDDSFAGAGEHLLGIIDQARRLDAEQLVSRMQGMCLMVVATVTADGRPLTGPVDGYLIHGGFYFSSGRRSVKMRHLARRPFCSATYLPGEEMSVTVHGRAELFDVMDPGRPELREAMLDHYLPRQGPAFQDWLEQADAVGARMAADRLFTFHLSPS